MVLLLPCPPSLPHLGHGLAAAEEREAELDDVDRPVAVLVKGAHRSPARTHAGGGGRVRTARSTPAPAVRSHMSWASVTAGSVGQRARMTCNRSSFDSAPCSSGSTASSRAYNERHDAQAQDGRGDVQREMPLRQPRTSTSRSDKSKRLRISIAWSNGQHHNKLGTSYCHRHQLDTHKINPAQRALAAAIKEVKKIRPLIELDLGNIDHRCNTRKPGRCKNTSERTLLLHESMAAI